MPLVVAVVVTAGCLIGVCWSSWQLFTRRPVLTIDTTGVRLGRRRFMVWSEIDAITELDGSAGDPSFAVVPKARRRKLWIGRDYVRNVAMFRYWLCDLLEEYRRTSAT